MEPNTDPSLTDTPPNKTKSNAKPHERVANDGTLTIDSKKSRRLQQKKRLKQPKPTPPDALLALPFDILLDILSQLPPSALSRLSRTCHSLHTFILQTHSALLSRLVINHRYSSLAKCLRLPVPISDIHDESLRTALLDEERLATHVRRPHYTHIQPPDPTKLCTCLTCLLRWNVLCLAVDFAHFQPTLDANKPLPTIPRGRTPAWNTALLAAHAKVVAKAVFPDTNPSAPLWHAAILEAHLASTVRAIRRHSSNRFNHRPRFRLTPADEASGADWFLNAKGPPSVDFPYHRDNYYMLEAYLPNRSWFGEERRWGYLPAEQHETDLEALRRWVRWRQQRRQEEGMDSWIMEFRASGWRPVLDLRVERPKEALKEVAAGEITIGETA